MVQIIVDSFSGGTDMDRRVTLNRIEEGLQRLPSEQLEMVSDFVSCLQDREKVGAVCAICDFVSCSLDR